MSGNMKAMILPAILQRVARLMPLAILFCLVSPLTADQFGDFTFTDIGGSITITDYPDTATGEVVIPATINGKPVTIIGEMAFQDCKWLTSVTIPDSVTTIENAAFQRCSFIASVTIGNSVTRIGGLAFGECIRLGAVRIPDSVTIIASGAFSDCYWLVDVDLGKGVTTIGSSAFLRAALDHIIIPASVESVGQSAFTHCNLKWATFQGAAPAVDPSAFTSQPSGFKLYYVNGSEGFTTPTWVGYPCFPGTPPQVTNGPPPATGKVGTQYYHNLTGSGTPAPVFRLTAGALPDGVVIDQRWGGYPLNGYPSTQGIFTATITADNGIPPVATQTFTINTNEYRTLAATATNGTVSGGGAHILNSTAILTASPSPGYLFTGWTGDAAGTANPLSVLMDADKTIGANFTPDSDSDGISDQDELTIYHTNPNLADSDTDGLSDYEEIFTYYTNPSVADTDGDGFLDGYEVLTGHLPLVATDKPALVAEARTAIEFTFAAAVGKSYRIEGSPDLATWTTVESGVAGTGGVIQRFYSTRNMPKRYFRVADEAAP